MLKVYVILLLLFTPWFFRVINWNVFENGIKVFLNIWNQHEYIITCIISSVVTVPNSVFGTNTSENPRFSVPISVPKQNTKYAN